MKENLRTSKRFRDSTLLQFPHGRYALSTRLLALIRLKLTYFRLIDFCQLTYSCQSITYVMQIRKKGAKKKIYQGIIFLIN